MERAVLLVLMTVVLAAPSSQESCNVLYPYCNNVSRTIHNSLYNYQENTVDVVTERVTQAFRNICSTELPRDRECFDHHFKFCSPAFKANFSGWMDEYEGQICEDKRVKPDIQKLLRHLALWWMYPGSDNHSESCLGKQSVKIRNKATTEAQSCFADAYADFIGEMIPGPGLINSSYNEMIRIYNRFYKGYFKCLWKLGRGLLSSCGTDSHKAYFLYHLLTIMKGADFSGTLDSEAANTSPRYGPRATVMAFGDPHVKPLNQPIVACASEGHSVFLDNEYARITGNNTAIAPNHPATVMTFLEVVLRDPRTGDSVAEYQAANSGLPATFINGMDRVTHPAGGEVVISGHKNHIMKITHAHSGTMVFISRFRDRYPLLLVRMAKNFLKRSTGLLVDGCFETIDTTRSVSKRSTECNRVCGNNEYTHSCLYDCHETGDPEFAGQAMEIKEVERTAEVEDAAMSDGGLDGSSALSAAPWLMILLCLTYFTM